MSSTLTIKTSPPAPPAPKWFGWILFGHTWERVVDGPDKEQAACALATVVNGLPRRPRDSCCMWSWQDPNATPPKALRHDEQYGLIGYWQGPPLLPSRSLAYGEEK